MRIPKIVHQLWKSEQTPSRWQEASRAVRKHHPGVFRIQRQSSHGSFGGSRSPRSTNEGPGPFFRLYTTLQARNTPITSHS